jgi:hypothetical protein
MRTFLTLLLSALVACSAQAETVPHAFRFTGFFHEQTAQWLPDASLIGSFEGDDANGNGIYELGELSSFFLGEQPYIGGCREADICGLFEFSYVRGGPLNFSASWGVFDENFEAYAGGSVRAGDFARSFSPLGSQVYLWRPETIFSISPVPEPAVFAMLALGLALIGLSLGWRQPRRNRYATSARGSRPNSNTAPALDKAALPT